MDMPVLIKQSVCHSNGVDLVVQWLGVTATMLMVLGLTLTLPTFVLFFFLYVFLGLSITFRDQC